MISDKQLLKTLSCTNTSNQGKHKMEKNENKHSKLGLIFIWQYVKKITVAIFYKMITHNFFVRWPLDYKEN